MKLLPTFDRHEDKARWFAAYCKPRQEQVAKVNLERQGFHSYLPRIKVRRHRRGKWVDTIEALFPRYIFIHVDPDQVSIAPVRSTLGVVSLVNFGGQPAIIANEVMESLIRLEDSASGLQLNDAVQYCAGEAIRLIDGPLAGMEGIFAQNDGEQRVLVLMELLGKANSIAVNRDWIVKAA